MEGIEQIQNGEQMSSVRNKLNQVITGAVSHDEVAEEFVAQDQTGVQEVSDSDTIVSENIMFRATLTQDSETTEAKISGADLLNAMQENIEGGGGDWESVPEITTRPDEDQMYNYYIPLRDRDGNYYKMPLRLVFE